MYKLSQVVGKIMFLDIETVACKKSFSELDQRLQELWIKKSLKFSKEYDESEDPANIFYDKAAIQSEFGKIICISTGIIVEDGKIELKSFYSDDEFDLLIQFVDYIENFFKNDQMGFSNRICTHNGREFDIPYIIRRLFINGIKVPEIFDISGKKPWDIKFILDTQEMWAFGDYKATTSLDLLSAIFGIESPKDDIKGADVTKVYYEQNDLKRIMTYCQKDVLTTARVFLSLNQLDNKLQIIENTNTMQDGLL